MSEYFSSPFPFHQIIKKKEVIKRLALEESIRANIRALVLMRVGEFAYDRNIGAEMWDFDKEVFYREREPYFESKKARQGKVESQSARTHFKSNLKKIIQENEIRLKVSNIKFDFEKVDGNMSVYQRKIMIQVPGRIISTGKMLSPPFKMSILYTPFTVESN